MADLAYLQKVVGVTFNDPSLLKLALVHSSYVNENPQAVPGSNERLEFLGDAVLGCVVAERLYHDFPQLAEGELTKLRAVLVRRDTLARLARAINLGDYLYLGKGEEASGGRHKVVNLAGALEAVIAAVFLDQGWAVAREFIVTLLRADFERVSRRCVTNDYKSQLQELVQSQQHLTPAYRTVRVTGPDHDRTFTVEVMVGDRVLGQGSGKSKKLAEAEAARAALERLSR